MKMCIRKYPLVEQIKNQKVANLVIVLALIFLCPLGIYWTIKYREEWFNKVSIRVAIVVFLIVWSAGIVMSFYAQQNYIANNQTNSGYTIEDEIAEETIPFETKTTVDNQLANGAKVIDRTGKNGKKRVTFKTKVRYGNLRSRYIASEEIIEVPTDEIIRIGGTK